MSVFSWEEFARTLFEESADALFVFDPMTEELLTVNPAALRLTGFPNGKFKQHKATYFFRSTIPGRLTRLREACQKTGFFHSQEDFYLRHAEDGRWTAVNLTVTRLHARPKPLAVIMARDISQRRQTERNLVDVLSRFERIAHSIPDCFWSADIAHDGQLRISYASPGWKRIWGYDPQDLYENPNFWTDTIIPEDRQAVVENHQRLLQTLQRQTVTYRIRNRSGEIRWIEDMASPVLDRHGKPIAIDGIARDVTDRKQLEDHLRQAQKMEAVGLLAGGVAHDFNNLLTGILGNVTMARAETNLDTVGELLAKTEQAAHRAAELVRQLLAFSRRSELDRQAVSLEPVVQEVVGIARATFDRRIQIIVETDSPLAKVQADASQVHQVLLNLLINARDAVDAALVADPSRSAFLRIRVIARNVTVTEADCTRWLDARPGRYVAIAVVDNGLGMDESIRARIFEPFFTTKGIGKGTGLGLSIVYGNMKQHGGWVTVESQPGQGAEFTVYFPAAPAASDDAEPGPAAPSQCAEPAKPVASLPPTPSAAFTLEDKSGPAKKNGHRRSELGPAASRRDSAPTVLLVDDESMIRDIGRRILERAGYRVLEAADGIEAVEAFVRDRDRIDLVILDLSMPRLSGRDAFEQLRQLDPDVRIILSSGFDRFADAEQPDLTADGFVAKPYSADDFLRAIHNALTPSPVG